MRHEIGEPPSVTANSHFVFPTPEYIARSKDYRQFENADELALWDELFGTIAASS